MIVAAELGNVMETEREWALSPQTASLRNLADIEARSGTGESGSSRSRVELPGRTRHVTRTILYSLNKPEDFILAIVNSRAWKTIGFTTCGDVQRNLTLE
jgi:hypothetical protein